MLISYAQNFEDVLLWRALKHVEAGFYIDIGAQSPVEDSVSLAFYEHGWRGVHVEPTPFYAAALRDARPDEEVIEAAISTEEGTITFFEVPRTGLATGVKQIADRHLADGLSVSSLEVKTLRLCTLLDRYENKDIHWLKIDVEGMERDVIESWLPSTARPWVVVVESTAPRSREVNCSEWEPQLLALGYEFANFDGLNRFYVHESQHQLAEALHVGPNIFDDFAVGGSTPYARMLNADLVDLRRQVEDETAAAVHLARGTGAIQPNGQTQVTFAQAIEALASEVARLRQSADASLHRIAELERSLFAVHASISWRVTAPFRRLKPSVDTMLLWPRQTARASLDRTMKWVSTRQRAKALLKRLVHLVPAVERRLIAYVQARGSASVTHPPWMIEPDPDVLSEWEKLLNVSPQDRSK